MKNIVCIISGPTASGKTSSSISLAKKFGGEIVNFDSLLFYKEITIGTAKPSIEEQDGVVHHMIDCHSIKSPINAADYLKEALPIINSIHKNNKIVYLVGGSGFYLQALLHGMYDSVTTPIEIVEKSNKLFSEKGISAFLDILARHDIESKNRYHENDHYRVRRAVEHFWTTGKKFSDSREQMQDKKKNSPSLDHKWNIFHCYLDLDKEQHFEIIQKRTKMMLENGLIKEAQNLLDQGFTGLEKPLLSIGYKEVFGYINGVYATLEEMEERINISTRQLAKSQRTWFNKVEKQQFNPITDQELIQSKFSSFISSLSEE
jgi:tRNA dimethylallyltransferase